MPPLPPQLPRRLRWLPRLCGRAWRLCRRSSHPSPSHPPVCCPLMLSPLLRRLLLLSPRWSRRRQRRALLSVSSLLPPEGAAAICCCTLDSPCMHSPRLDIDRRRTSSPPVPFAQSPPPSLFTPQSLAGPSPLPPAQSAASSPLPGSPATRPAAPRCGAACVSPGTAPPRRRRSTRTRRPKPCQAS